MNNGKICVSICAESAEELIGKIKRADGIADIIEVRFDCLNESELIREYSAITVDVRQQVFEIQLEKPIISTFRPKAQGGNRRLTFEERRDFWNMGFDKGWADMEEDVLHFASYWIWDTIIASFHDLSGETSRLSAVNTMFDRIAIDGVDIVKIAVKADDITDSIPVWNLLNHARAANKPIIPIAMGEAGKWTRILGLAHGAYMTYATLDPGGETAAGQLTAKELIDVYRVRELDRDTQVYGVIGDPVSGSLSLYIHNAAFAATGINAVFIPLQVKDLDEFIRRMVCKETREVQLNFAGFAVTMPHKQAIMRHLDNIDTAAEKIGAVNTVKIDGERLTGYNTDAYGFIEPLRSRYSNLKRSRVAILGAGGAARACVSSLQQENADITVFARDERKAKGLADDFGIGWSDLSKIQDQSSKIFSNDFDIVVNATPMGMSGPLAGQTLLTAQQLEGVKFVFDIVTSAEDTPLIKEAKMARVSTISGDEMLLYQGAKQFEIWTGRSAPLETMREALINKQKEARR